MDVYILNACTTKGRYFSIFSDKQTAMAVLRNYLMAEEFKEIRHHLEKYNLKLDKVIDFEIYTVDGYEFIVHNDDTDNDVYLRLSNRWGKVEISIHLSTVDSFREVSIS